MAHTRPVLAAAVAVGLVIAQGGAQSAVVVVSVVAPVLVALVAFEWVAYWGGEPELVTGIEA